MLINNRGERAVPLETIPKSIMGVNTFEAQAGFGFSRWLAARKMLARITSNLSRVTGSSKKHTRFPVVLAFRCGAEAAK